MGLMKRDKVKSKEDLMFRDGGSIKNIKVYILKIVMETN
jgi:hypothetical protein